MEDEIRNVDPNSDLRRQDRVLVKPVTFINRLCALAGDVVRSHSKCLIAPTLHLGSSFTGANYTECRVQLGSQQFTASFISMYGSAR